MSSFGSYVFYQAGKYVWLTYKEVYETVVKVGASIRSCGVQKVRMIYFCYNVVVTYSDDSTAQDNFTAELAIHIFVL